MHVKWLNPTQSEALRSIPGGPAAVSGPGGIGRATPLRAPQPASRATFFPLSAAPCGGEGRGEVVQQGQFPQLEQTAAQESGHPYRPSNREERTNPTSPQPSPSRFGLPIKESGSPIGPEREKMGAHTIRRFLSPTLRCLIQQPCRHFPNHERP